MVMAYERQRCLSTDSEKSSSSRSYSTESIRNGRTLSPHQNCLKNSNRLNSSDNYSERKLKIKSKKFDQFQICPTRSIDAQLPLESMRINFIDLNPFFQCSPLPSHWRKNKSLRFFLRVNNRLQIKSNTRVIIYAGNDHNPSAQMKNNISTFENDQAEFRDLRFLSASGRGKRFTLNIIIDTEPPQQCTYRNAIKITVDGPRKKRHSKAKSDVHDEQHAGSASDDQYDDETRMTSTSTISESKPSIGQNSSGLDLLAAVAAQKWEDEQDQSHSRPIQSSSVNINYPCHSASPPSSFVSHFAQSIRFSPVDDYSLNSLLPHTTNLLLRQKNCGFC